MTELQFKILKAMIIYERSRVSLVEDFGPHTKRHLDYLKSKELVDFNLGTGRRGNIFNVKLTEKARKMIDEEFCSACECSPCDCSWGNDE